MKLSFLTPALLGFLALACPAGAADLTKVPRTIGKEPAYATKSPRYCLVVIGPEAKARVWLVVDGDTLYLDRNGNGDLTEEGEQVKLPELNKVERGWMTGMRQHSAGVVTAWPERRLQLQLMQYAVKPDHKPESPDEADIVKLIGAVSGGLVTGIMITDDVKDDPKAEGRNMYVAMADSAGALSFANRPEDAPIVHVHGPLVMSLHPFQRLTAGQETELKAGLGTPGLGKGTFALSTYGHIPADAHPVAAIEFSAAPGKTPAKITATLSQRC